MEQQITVRKIVDRDEVRFEYEGRAEFKCRDSYYGRNLTKHTEMEHDEGADGELYALHPRSVSYGLRHRLVRVSPYAYSNNNAYSVNGGGRTYEIPAFDDAESAAARAEKLLTRITSWHKNGDHPEDYSAEREDCPDTNYRRENDWEGDIVRYFRRPDVAGELLCSECWQPFHVHGWIDTLEDGHRVCPGDWIGGSRADRDSRTHSDGETDGTNQ